MIEIRIPRVLETFSALIVVIIDVIVDVVAAIAGSHASVLIKIINSAIRVYSRKKKPGAAGSDWSCSNETVNYLSYSRHAGFVVSWKTHVTCSIRTEKCIPTLVTSFWVLSLRYSHLYSRLIEIYLKSLTNGKLRIKFYISERTQCDDSTL